MVISVFMFVKEAVSAGRHRVYRTVSRIGSLTSGMYLMDPVIGPFFKHLFDFKGDRDKFWSSIVYCIFSMTLGGILTLLYRKLKTLITRKTG